ncbi:class I SAM-dependent methyltransferase [Colwellia maritima]|uniref:class I SAM-dependent methyltransferase n=1 Tax=Colwellia maritima TaxID=2912588 RepID=UPI003B849DB7
MQSNFYNDNATDLAMQYLSKSFEELHQSRSQFLPAIIENPNAHILDLGGGSGRDAKYLGELAAKTHKKDNQIQIIAVEPANELLAIGKKTTHGLKVKWLEDSLPELTHVSEQEISFDLILLSAVWMHIPPSDRDRSMRKLANLLKPGGIIVISLRHGQTEDDYKTRKMFDVCADELKRLATDVGLFTKLETPKEADKLGRNHVSWQTVVLQMPNDNTGAFSFKRHVAINNGKSATHKLALLRVLLRITDGHLDAVIRRETSLFGDRVILPAGLVTLYWWYYYKGLLPTDSDVNNQKNDRLPTEQKLQQAKERIQHWWQAAWLNNNTGSVATDIKNDAKNDELNEVSAGYAISTTHLISSDKIAPKNHAEKIQQKRFFAEANIALPG